MAQSLWNPHLHCKHSICESMTTLLVAFLTLQHVTLGVSYLLDMPLAEDLLWWHLWSRG
jgi:hypothetical protein